MDYFEDLYLKRIGKYGFDYNTRIQHKREKEFELYLARSAYRVEFDYRDAKYYGALERYRQDETQTLQYFLTRRSLALPPGTVIHAKANNGEKTCWLVLFLEDIRASGYNRHIVLKMTQLLEWKDGQSLCCLIGPGQKFIHDTVKSSARHVVYLEDFNYYMLVMPKNAGIRKDTYLTIGSGWERTGFKVTGYDILSNPDVEYVTLEPVYLRDESPIPEKTEDSNDEDYFWFQGVMKDG